MAGVRASTASVWRTAAFRLTASVTALFLCAALAIVGAIYWSTSNLLLQQVVDDTARRGAALRQAIRVADRDSAVRIVTALAASSDGLYLLWSPVEQRRLAGNLENWPPSVMADGKAGVFTSRHGGRDRVAVGIGYRLAGGRQLLVARTADVYQHLTSRLQWVVIVASLVIVGLGAVAGWVLALMVMGRIRGFARAGERFMQGQSDVRVPVSGARDEFDELAQSLNHMFERIGQLMAGMREVSDNIAHDLKTPLNRLRIRAEEALASDEGDAARRRALEEIVAETDNIIRTFNALLQVARLEAGTMELPAEPFDLTALLRDVVELYEPVAEDAGAELTIVQADAVAIRGSRQLVGQALANLIENALKYGVANAADTEPETRPRVEVGLVERPDAIVIEVADRGPGIAEHERASALRRFVRLDTSRSKPGSGLGLSVVAAVARSHGGRVVLADNAPGLRAELRLPRDLQTELSGVMRQQPKPRTEEFA